MSQKSDKIHLFEKICSKNGFFLGTYVVKVKGVRNIESFSAKGCFSLT